MQYFHLTDRIIILSNNLFPCGLITSLHKPSVFLVRELANSIRFLMVIQRTSGILNFKIFNMLPVFSYFISKIQFLIFRCQQINKFHFIFYPDFAGRCHWFHRERRKPYRYSGRVLIKRDIYQ